MKLAGSTGTMSIPCGRCIGCRLDHSRDWAVRCMHELKATGENKSWFITLTYNNENLPPHGSLVKSDYQKFMKRLRKHYKSQIKFLHCGEYGEKLKRPHYHAILFGIEFDDLEVKTKRKSGYLSYYSKTLHDIWGKGFIDIGTVTFQSAAYVARYITKKVSGEAKDLHYCTGAVEESTGEIIKRQPEYMTVSNKSHRESQIKGRGGLGYRFYELYKHDMFNIGQVVMYNGEQSFQCRIPQYYRDCYKVDHPELFEEYKTKLLEIFRNKPTKDKSQSRLDVMNECDEQRFSKLIRSYEIDES